MSKNLVTKISGKTDKKVIYRIEKDFSINNIDLIKTELSEIVAKNNPFTLELKNIDSFDLSSVQLLKALQNKMKDNLILSIELKDDLKVIIQNAGFENIILK
jgi:hypothetical protein